MPLNRGVTKKEEEQGNKRILANRYQVIKKLGSGNYGTAFLVKDLKPGKTDELKVIKEISVGDLAPDETIGAVREANLLSSLKHPNIVKFCDSFIDGEFFCLVTEYCDGGDLDQKVSALKSSGDRLDEATILQYLIQLTMGVHYMHQRRVLHRDLKARNIFLRGNMVKIGDFGISRILMGTTDMATTFTGTPYYMSPEVLQHNGYNSKSDVWSIGCILYELCTKKHAFEGQGLMGVMYKIVEGKPPKLPQEYSSDLQGILDRIFVKDPDKRASAGEILKIPYVERHIQMYRTSMTSQCKDLSQTLINQDRLAIQEMAGQRTCLEDLGSNELKTIKLKEDNESHLTPKERMLRRKQREADERAKEIGEAVKSESFKNSEFNRLRKKQTMLSSSSISREPTLYLPPLEPSTFRPLALGEAGTAWFNPESARRFSYPSNMLPFPNSRQQTSLNFPAVSPQTGIAYNPDGTLTAGYGPAVEDETLTRDMRPGAVANASFYPGGIGKTPALLSPSYKVPAYDERPITPMKNTNIYDLKYNEMQFKDGTRAPKKFDPTTLLEDPKLAETYYSQYDHEFDDDEEKEGGQADDDFDATDDSVAEFYQYLQLALDTSMTSAISQTFADDPKRDVYGENAKGAKIKNLRMECIQKLGEPTFNKVYNYLKDRRFKSSNFTETQIMDGLRPICGNMANCFLVDQLLFLEESAGQV